MPSEVSTKADEDHLRMALPRLLQRGTTRTLGVTNTEGGQVTADLRQHFDDYARAHDVYDLKRILSFFHCPMITIRQGKVILLETPEKIHDFYSKLLDGFREMNLARAVISSFSSRPSGPNGAVVDILWSPSRADGTVITRFHQMYNLVSLEQNWKIVVSTRVE